MSTSSSKKKSKSVNEASAYKKNQQGIIADDDNNLTNLVSAMNDVKDKEHSDDNMALFVDRLKKSKVANKNFLQRVWHSLAMEDITKPKSFTSLKVDKLCESLFHSRKDIADKLEKIYNSNKVDQYINTHSISESNILVSKPMSGTLVNVGKLSENTLIKIGKAKVVESGSLQDDEKVRISISDLVPECNLVHNDDEFQVGVIVDWNWKHLAKHIEPLKRSSEDSVLGTTLRPRTISKSSSTLSTDVTGAEAGSTNVDDSSNGITSGEVVNYLDKINSLTASLEKLKKENDSLSKQVTDLKRKREENVATISKLQKQNDQYHKRVDQCRDFILDMTKKANELEVFKSEGGKYFLTFDEQRVELLEEDADTLSVCKQYNIGMGTLMDVFNLEKITELQWKALDVMVNRLCPLMAKSSYRFKNFKSKFKEKYSNEKDSKTKYSVEIEVVDDEGISKLILSKNVDNAVELDDENTNIDE